MKIIDFAPYYYPHIGGLEKYAEELHENLAKKNCEITVFTPHIPKSALKEESKFNITIIRYPAFDIIFNYPLPCIWKKEFWRQWRKINEINFDFAISTLRFFVQPLIALFFSRKHKIPLLHIEHCSDYVKNKFFVSLISRIVDMTIGRFSLSRADRIITPSQSAARFVNILSGKKSLVIYRGMPYAEIDGISPKNTLRQQFKNKKIITYVGRVIYGKGIIHLLEAMYLLNRSDTVALIVGDGPEIKKLEEYVESHNLKEKVIFIGSVPFAEVIAILKITDILVNPSYNEGLPTSILEAGVCRRAIIATNVGGTLEIIAHNQSGIIIKPYSTEEVKNALEKLLGDSELRNRLGEKACQEIKQKFNWENTISAYLKEMEFLKKKYEDIQ